MADLVSTPQDVAIGITGGFVIVEQVGEAVTQGQVGYLDAGTNTYLLADKTDPLKFNANGFFLTPAPANGYAAILTGGAVNLGAVLTVGEVYVLSAAGAISPVADIVAGDYVTTLGIAISATDLQVNFKASGVQAA